MNFHLARVAPEKAVFRPALPCVVLPGITEMQVEKLTYIQQLRHPNWQRRRLEVLNQSGFMCQRCMATENTLHVHHKQYLKDRLAWEYEDEELIVICESCHKAEHEHLDELKIEIANSWRSPEELVLVIRGFNLPFDGQCGIGSSLEWAASLIEELSILSWENLLLIRKHAKEMFAQQRMADESEKESDA